MKLFLISAGIDSTTPSYSSAVIAAPDAEVALRTNLYSGEVEDVAGKGFGWCYSPTIRYIGEASDCVVPGVLSASYNEY